MVFPFCAANRDAFKPNTPACHDSDAFPRDRPDRQTDRQTPHLPRLAERHSPSAKAPNRQLRLQQDGGVLVVDLVVPHGRFELQERRVHPAERRRARLSLRHRRHRKRLERRGGANSIIHPLEVWYDSLCRCLHVIHTYTQ